MAEECLWWLGRLTGDQVRLVPAGKRAWRLERWTGSKWVLA